MATSTIKKVITPKDKIIALKTYTAEYSIAANNYTTITGSELGLSVPTGMRVIGIRNYSTGNSFVYASMIRHDTSGSCVQLRSNGNIASTGTFTIGFIYAKNDMVDVIS